MATAPDDDDQEGDSSGRLGLRVPSASTLSGSRSCFRAITYTVSHRASRPCLCEAETAPFHAQNVALLPKWQQTKWITCELHFMLIVVVARLKKCPLQTQFMADDEDGISTGKSADRPAVNIFCKLHPSQSLDIFCSTCSYMSTSGVAKPRHTRACARATFACARATFACARATLHS